MKVGLILRFHYEENDPRLEWRFNYFKEKVLPRIIAQTYKNFDICIWINEWQKEMFLPLLKVVLRPEEEPRIKLFTVRNTSVSYREVLGRKYFYDFASWEDVEGLEKYDLQLGLDSDDLISTKYIAEAVKAVKNKYFKHHICFQPQVLILKTGEIKPMKIKYNTSMGSAFMGLYQPEKEDYKFIYESSHLTLGRLARRSKVLPEGFCWVSVHQHNESTGK